MKIRVRFSKQEQMKFIGHLDMVRYFQKVMRRGEIDVAYSEGFSPHQKMSFAAPLSVGVLCQKCHGCYVCCRLFCIYRYIYRR